MTTMFEKPTVPTPATLVEVKPALNQGDMVNLPEVSNDSKDGVVRPVLGEIATREEYRSDVDEETVVDPTKNDNAAEAARATLSRDPEDDKVREELFSGFHIKDSTQVDGESSEDVDELPDNLKDELGEPDIDEVDAA